MNMEFNTPMQDEVTKWIQTSSQCIVTTNDPISVALQKLVDFDFKYLIVRDQSAKFLGYLSASQIIKVSKQVTRPSNEVDNYTGKKLTL